MHETHATPATVLLCSPPNREQVAVMLAEMSTQAGGDSGYAVCILEVITTLIPNPYVHI